MPDDITPPATTPPAGSKPKLADLIKEHSLQDELNTFLAENRRNLTKQNQELVTQLEQLKTNSKLTQEERDDLQSRITQLEEQYMTKEELAKREGAKFQKKYEEDTSKLKTEGERWKNLYSSSTIDRALLDAAVEGKALHPNQIVDLLKTRTQLTDDLVPIVKFNDINEEGKQVVLDLPPNEAIKRMKELVNLYGNLFEGTATGGAGGSKGADGSAQNVKLKDLLKDPVKYAEWRKKNPDLDTSKLMR